MKSPTLLTCPSRALCAVLASLLCIAHVGADDVTSAKLRELFGESMESAHEIMEAQPHTLKELKLVKQDETLRGLGPVYPMTRYIFAVKNSQEVDETLTDQVIERLEEGSVGAATKEEMDAIPGNPELQFYLSVFEHQECCYITLWMSLLQTAALTRDLTIHKKVGTWGTGERFECSEGRKEGDVSEIVLSAVDKFIEAYQKINTEKNQASDAETLNASELEG